VGIQIIKHQADFLSMGIMLINEFSHKIGPVNFRTLISDFRRALTSSWFKSYENVRGPISLLRCIIPEWLPRLGWESSTDFPNHLRRHFIHTHERTLGIRRFFVNISDFFHVADKGGILLWGNTPF